MIEIAPVQQTGMMNRQIESIPGGSYEKFWDQWRRRNNERLTSKDVMREQMTRAITAAAESKALKCPEPHWPTGTGEPRKGAAGLLITAAAETETRTREA